MYCRIPAQQTECSGRLVVSKLQGLKRMEMVPKSFHIDLPKVGNTRCRPICIQTFTSGSRLHGLETRSREQSYRCSPTILEKLIPLYISPIQSHRPGFRKSEKGKSTVNSGYSTLAASAMVCKIITNVNKESIASASVQKFVKRPIRSNTSCSNKQISSVRSLDDFREHLAAEGISKQAANLVSNCSRTGTTSSYESACHNWSGWCNQQKVDPFQCSLSHVLNYLADLFSQNYEYRSINLCKSSISAYHDNIDGFKVRKYPKVCALLTGVFNNR